MGMPSSDGLNVIPPWVRPGEGFTFPENGDIIKPSRGKEVYEMAFHGLVKDSPLLTAVQRSTRKGRKNAKYEDEMEEILAFLLPMINKLEVWFDSHKKAKK
jgi:hypothetical protein